MATRKQFVHLTATHPLVEELVGKHEWWIELVKRSLKDPEISIQVRGDYLSVYNRMGSLLAIRLKNKKVVCRTHYKYLIASRRNEYVDVRPSGTGPCRLPSVLRPGNFDSRRKRTSSGSSRISPDSQARKRVFSPNWWRRTATLCSMSK